MSAGEEPGEAGTSRPDDDEHRSAKVPSGGGHRVRGRRRLLVPLGVLAVPVVAVAVVVLLTDALDGRGVPLWMLALVVTAAGVAVLFGGYGAMRRFAGRQEEDHRAGFRTEVRRWAEERGWQVRDGGSPAGSGARDGRPVPPEGTPQEVPQEVVPPEMTPQMAPAEMPEGSLPVTMLPEGLLPPALDPLELVQVITGHRNRRAVRMEAWSVGIRRSASVAATSGVGQLIRIQARADLPLVALADERSTEAITAITPPAVARHHPQRREGLVAIGSPGALEQVIDTLGTFAGDIRRTGSWVLLRPGAVNLFFATEPDVAVLQVRLDMGVAMAEELDRLASRSH